MEAAGREDFKGLGSEQALDLESGPDQGAPTGDSRDTDS